MTTWVWISIGTILITCIILLYFAKVVLPRRLHRRLQESAKAFATAIELRFPAQHGLTDRVVGLSRLLGKAAELNEHQLYRLEMSARLCKIGLCAMPFRLMNEKPPAQWSLAEQSMFNQHTEVSGSMLDLLPPLQEVAELVRHHQTKFAPEHYGIKISGNDIPVESRILKITADYVWLEKYQGDFLAQEVLRMEKGHEYDPVLVERFLAVLRSNRVDKPFAQAG